MHGNVFRSELCVERVGIVGVDIDIPRGPFVARMIRLWMHVTRNDLEHQHNVIASDKSPIVVDISVAATFIRHVEAKLRLVEGERSRQIIDNEKRSGAYQHGSKLTDSLRYSRKSAVKN